MIETIVPNPPVRSKTFTLTLPFTCPKCQQGCGYLYGEEGERQLCLGCKIEWDEFLAEEAAFKLQVQAEEQRRWEAAGRLAELLGEEDRAREAWEAEQVEEAAEACWLEEGERRHDEEVNSDCDRYGCGID